jgi:hypothetical protein
MIKIAIGWFQRPISNPSNAVLGIRDGTIAI